MMTGFRVWLILRVVAFVLVTAALCCPAAGKTIYVDDDAAGANDGSSWADAFTYLQEALAEAASMEKPVEIRVAQGIYKPSEGLMAIPEFDWRTTTFQLINGVTLKGGYAGITAPDPNARDIELYETILSGDLNGDDAEVADLHNLLEEPTRVENSYHVVTGSNIDATTVIDGFVITAGNANVSGESNSAGGGMRNDAGNPTVINCTFVTNAANNGGGIGNLNADVTMINCKLTDNYAISGAGMDNISSQVTLSNSTFYGNVSIDDGGAIRNIASTPVITNCILWGNTPPQLTGEAEVLYSEVQGGWPGEGNIDADPLFADADNGDFHLKSQAGRWDAVSGSWVFDDVTSPCIDAGDPNSPVAAEPYPNGGIIDMGAYGGTAEASKSPSGEHSKYGGGIGEPNAPYLIYTAEQMNTIGLHAEDWDKHFKLMADIDLAEYTGTSFNLIGRYIYMQVDLPFSGTFDGNGHIISNFTYTAEDVDDIAMFAYVWGSNAAIKNLGLIDPNVSVSGQDGGAANSNDPDIDPSQYIGTGNNVASLVRWMRSGTITGCYARGGRISGRDRVGGLVAYNEGIIIDCYSDVEVNGKGDVGGLVGCNEGEIAGCRSFGGVSASRNVGGLAGKNFNSGTILDSYSGGQVVGDKFVGGLVGWSKGFISNCDSQSDVVGINYDIGGLVGRSLGEISDCYASGSVTGFEVVGGLAGQNQGGIMNCYAAGIVTGDNWTGGLAGWDPADNIVASFWDIETTGQATSQGGIGKTTAEMQSAATFLDAGWDFVDETENGTDDIWWIDEGRDYPRLSWEIAEDN